MKKTMFWKIILFAGMAPFLALVLLGIYTMSVEAGWTWADWLILYSFVYWPTYIIGLALILFSVNKLKHKEEKVDSLL